MISAILLIPTISQENMEKSGFYPKHVQMEIRHNQTPLPDEQLNSDSNTESGRPLRPQYNTPKPPITIGGNHDDSYRTDEVNVLLPVLIGFIVALVLAIIILVFYLLRKCLLIKHQNLSKTASICIRKRVDETTIHQPPTGSYILSKCDIAEYCDIERCEFPALIYITFFNCSVYLTQQSNISKTSKLNQYSQHYFSNVIQTK
ncbi:uncharacterized protein [Chanodichthys erythropterus]|uniref:uncharacterized protein isoform X2 n=1 Tax=Chanodichthys erythropterus TaxID=933992 RepID=UPI00351EC850